MSDRPELRGSGDGDVHVRRFQVIDGRHVLRARREYDDDIQLGTKGDILAGFAGGPFEGEGAV